MPCIATCETPCSLTYGTEAVIQMEIWVHSARVDTFDDSHNDEELLANLDLLEEN